MDFTPDIIFKLFGQFDKVVVISFKETSKSFNCFGKDLTGIFYYSIKERKNLEDHLISNGKNLPHDFIKFEILLKTELTNENLKLIEREGINTEDILNVFTLDHKNINKFNIQGVKELQLDIINVNLNLDSPLTLFINFYESRINSGETLLDFEKSTYAAIKWLVDGVYTKSFYEEYILDVDNNCPKLSVLFHKMQFEIEQGISKPEEHKEITHKYLDNLKVIIEKQLSDLGIKKDDYNNPKKLLWLFLSLLEMGWIFQHEIYLYSSPKIYLDFEGLLHIFLKHTDVFSVNNAHVNRSKFSYQLKDLKNLLKVIIQKHSEEIENHYNKNGSNQLRMKSIYHEGDYYSLSISKDGRIESFHPNK